VQQDGINRTFYEVLGGEQGVRALVKVFYDLV
jgi:truncated hemoglobin YjbI